MSQSSRLSLPASARCSVVRRRSSWGALAVAATTLAFSATSGGGGGGGCASAFVTSAPPPLRGAAAPGRCAPLVEGDCCGRSSSSAAAASCSSLAPSRGIRRGPLCPPLVMALTDPETLLRDEIEEQFGIHRRGGGGGGGGGGSIGQEKALDLAYLEGLSKIRLGMEVKENDGPKEGVAATGGGGGGGDAADRTVAPSKRPPQNIESEIEIVTQEPSSVVDVAARASRVVAPKRSSAATAAAATANSATATATSTVAAIPKPVAAIAASTGYGDDDRRSDAQSKVSAGAAVSMKSNSGGGGRSSTMPGFEGRRRRATGRVRSFRDGVALAEERSGRAIGSRAGVGDEGTKRRRRKANSEAMYKGSASVPDSLIAFTNEIHEECARITPTEEIELGELTQEAIRIQTLHDDLEAKLGRAPSDEEWCAAAGKINTEALGQAIEEGMEAKNRLVTSNLRMVQGVVNLYIRNGLGSQYNAGDLMQEGILALIRAAEKFDPGRGFRFSTYAMYWIRAAVKRSQIIQSRVVQVPQRLHETHKRVLKVEKGLRTELGRQPTKSELATAADLSEVQLDRCLKAMAQECHSLDATIQNTLNPNKHSDSRKDTMYDLVDSRREDDGRNELTQQLTREALVDTLRRYLSPHEVDLLLLRFGLMDERTLPHGFSGPLTIAEVSRLVGLKPDKVRRMINGCLRRLRPLIAHEWEDFENELP